MHMAQVCSWHEKGYLRRKIFGKKLGGMCKTDENSHHKSKLQTDIYKQYT